MAGDYHFKKSDDWNRMTSINSFGAGPVDFDLPDSTKEKLIKSGADGTAAYFDWYDYAAGKNRPHNDPNYKAASV